MKSTGEFMENGDSTKAAVRTEPQEVLKRRERDGLDIATATGD